MSSKYGVPDYDHDGRIIGICYDNDGDGIFDDYETVVSDPISSGDEFMVIPSDHDGDGTYDDSTFVVCPTPSHSHRSAKREEVSSSETHYPPSSGGGSSFSSKAKKKTLLIILASLVGLAILGRIITFIIACIAYMMQ